jgi:hypothetical protein
MISRAGRGFGRVMIREHDIGSRAVVHEFAIH